MRSLSFFRLGQMIGELPRILFRHPLLVVPSVAAFCWMIVFSSFFQRVKDTLPISSESGFWIWSGVTTLIALAGLTFFFTLLFVLCKRTVENQKNQRFFSSTLTIWPHLFTLSLVFLFVFNLVRLFAQYGATFFGEIFLLSLPVALGVFTVLYYLAMIGFALFFSYAPSIVVVENASWILAIGRSFNLVRQNYLPTLTISVGYFILTGILERVAGQVLFGFSLSEVLHTLFVYPLLALLLTMIVVASKKGS